MIETGRRHQIRMAMQSIGHPIVGDSLHGAETIHFLEYVTCNITGISSPRY